MSAEQKERGFEVYRLTPFIEEAVKANAAKWKNGRKESSEARTEVLRKWWGDTADEDFRFRPSVVSNCLRWEGYDALGYKPAPSKFRKEMNFEFGSAAHAKILRILGPYGIESQPLIDEDLMARGELDFLFKNPRTKEFQILDFKFVQDFSFRKVEKRGPTYIPSPEVKLQILIYMWLKRKEGLNVSMGNVIYINRNSWETKECFIPWDAAAEYEMNEFLLKAKVAREKILAGELPEPSVISSYVCAAMCPFRGYCEYGQKFAAKREKGIKKRKPSWVYKQVKEKAEQREVKAKKMGIIQEKLF